MPKYNKNSNLRLLTQKSQEEVECLDQNVPVFPENTQKNISPHVSKERHINNMEHKYKNKSKLTLPLSQIHRKTFYILPLSKKISSPHKQNKQDSHILSIFPPPPKFFPKHVLFFLFLEGGEKFFLTFVVLKGSCCSSQGESPLFFVELDSFVSLILYFLLTFVAYVFYLLFVLVVFINT